MTRCRRSRRVIVLCPAVNGDWHAGQVKTPAAWPENGPAWTELPLTVRPPFNGRDLLALLALSAVPGVSQIADGAIERSARFAGGPAVIRVSCVGQAPVASALLSSPADATEAAAACARLIDADVDPVAVDRTLSADPALTESVRQMPGIRMPGSIDGTEILVSTIVGQQISVAAARVAQAKIVARFGDRLPAQWCRGAVTHLFPSASALATAEPADLGMPRSRGRSVVAAAHDLADGSLVVAPNVTRDELVKQLIARPGIGPWTASYVAMRVLGANDELLTGDLVLRAGARELGLPYTPVGLAGYGKRWSPYRSYAGLHLWRAALLLSRGGWPAPW